MGRSQILRRAVASTLALPAAFEPLEQRLQMSASAITLSGGVLTLTGMTGTGNTITSSLSGSNLTVKLDGTTKTFAAASISKIVVTGGTHGDYIKLATNSTIPDIINSGDGNDTIVSGAGNDVIDAGAGNDNVDGSAGYDIALNAESRKNIESTSASNTLTPTPTTGNTPAGVGGSISGLFWGDSNANGAIDAGEPMATARTAFIDKNGNGKLDSGEPTTTTDSTGRYTFTNLSAGSYKIGRVFPSGYKISNSTSADLSVVLASGQKITNANIGSIPTSQTPTGSGNTPASATGSISGLFWGDSNANGAIDAGEPMAAARTAFIDTNGNGKLDSGETSATT
ncbi:MAG: SdrD B-like domain-containing protein, partial [Tepidisphaeraceae bacterium]